MRIYYGYKRDYYKTNLFKLFTLLNYLIHNKTLYTRTHTHTTNICIIEIYLN